MGERTLVLEGLPDDLELVKSKLELYFKNKRRSGGEIMKIQVHPDDKRKALLVYQEEGDCKKVLEKKIHKIDFKDHGHVELTVKLEAKREKPAVLPKPKIEKCENVKSAQVTAVGQTSEIHKGNEETCTPQELLVTTDEESDKDLLSLYFEQYTENVELRKYGKNSWILKLSNQSDLQKILAQKKHEHGVSVKLYTEGSMTGKLDPHRFILTGFKDTSKIDIITLFINSCSKKAEHTWELLDDDRIVVTFKDDIDAKLFLEKCTSKKLQDMEIGASQLELTDSVLIKGDMSNIKEEFLTLYFSNKKRSGGGEIKSVLWVSKPKSLVLSYEDSQDAHQVVMRKHTISETDLSTSLFYSGLQKALTGKTPRLSNLATSITIPVDEQVLSFIKQHEEHKNGFYDELSKVHTNVILDKSSSPREIVLEMDVEADSLAALRVGPSWESRARGTAQNFLKNYSMETLPAGAEVWKRIESECLQLSSSDTEVSYSGNRILIVGKKNSVTIISNKAKNLLDNATAKLEEERNTVDRAIQLDSKEKFDLVEERVKHKLMGVHFSKDKSALTFHLRGLRDKVNNAEKIIKEAQGSVVFQQLNLSPSLLQFLKSLDLTKFEQDHFVTNCIPAFFQHNKDCIGILGEKENIKKAENKFYEIVKEEVIQLAPDLTTDLGGENRMNFFKTLKTELELSNNVHNVNIIPSDVKIVICGFAHVVADISQKVKGYLMNKTPATEDVRLKSFKEVEFVESCMNFSEIPELRNFGVTVLTCTSKDSPCLKITAAKEKIKDAVSVVTKHVSAILVEQQVYSKAGESKVILKHEANVKAKAKEFGCKANLLIEQVIVTPKSYTHKISNHMTLTIAKDNLLRYTVDAFVCPMNSNLVFDNPTAHQFLQVAGSKIQTVCNKIQKEQQSLLAGDVLLSEPGNLPAKILIYAVLPNSGQNLGCRYLESAVLDCLNKAEERNSASIAMPAVGCGTFGFSVQESCTAIKEAILQFCNGQNTPKNLKNVFVVDSDDKTVEEFNTLIAQLGFSTVKTSTQTANTTPQRPLQSLKIKQGSDTEATVHGVLVSLKKGDITKEKVDVIVNSNNSDLNLDTGVSGAILKAAGKTVEDECQKHGRQKPDGVVLTSGGNLSCKHIAQIVGPNNAIDITASIEKVLKLCESKMAATAAIPAIGTGRGNIGVEESIQAILTGLENHLTQLKSSCLKEITIVAFEQKIFDAYQSYLKKQNKPSSTGTQTAHTLPPNQVKIAGVRIEVKKGNLTNETVRGIVNTTNNQMNLTKGVSGAIFKAAGPSVVQECQNHGPIQSDTVAVTSGGNLQCDFIIHMMGPHSAAEARLRVKKVLESCEQNQISTVSFPAVGTGGGGVKSAESITAMLQGFEDHLSQRTSTAVKLIYIVTDQDPVLNEFLQGLKQWNTNLGSSKQDSDDEYSSEDELEDEDSESNYGSDEEEDLSANTAEAIIGPVKVKVFCGDITKETTDAIVSSTNTSLDLASGVSGAILKAAGPAVQQECKKLGTQPSDGVVLTTAGNLPMKNIVHMVGQTKEKEITNSMYKVLKLCEQNNIQSVSFPALGTGAGNLAPAQVANAMIDAVANISIDNPACLKTVHIVIFQAKMLQDFAEGLKKFKKISPKPAQVTIPTRASHQSKPPLCLATATAAVTFPTMNVEIYGTSSTDLAKFKNFLSKLISEECTSKDVQSKHLANLSEADKEAILALSQSNQVQILVVAADKMTVSGKKEDVLTTVMKIRDFVQAAEHRENQGVAEERLSKTLCWEVAKGESWVSLGPSISYQLEQAFHGNKKTFNYQIKGETYTVDFKEMKQVNSKKVSCRIKRTLFGDSDTAIIQPPPTWTKMDGNDLEIIDLSSNSEEYKKIANQFLVTSKHPDVSPVEVVKVCRIQSQSQWQRYSVLKHAVDKKYPKQKNETFLYHGTTKDICEKINKNGFNRSFCGRNAVYYGEGTYFANEAWYSCQDTYSNPDDNGLKYIYRARVVTGLMCLGRKGMKEPDPLDANNPRAGLYDCAVNDLQKPLIFVVFCDAGAYPDYLITFKNV